MKTIHVLPANMYGPGDQGDLDTSHVVPAVIRKCVDAQRAGHGHVTLWGTGTATREFLYVEDGAEALVLAGERYDKPEPVNIGTGREIATRLWINLQAAYDLSRAEKEFGFRATVSLEDGLRRTIEWYGANNANG